MVCVMQFPGADADDSGMDELELKEAFAAARVSFQSFLEEQEALISEHDRLLTEQGFVLEVVHLPDADPAEDFEDDGDDDGMLAACLRGDYACYRVSLHNEEILLEEVCSWSKPGLSDGKYTALASLPDTLALDVADEFAQALRQHAGE